MMSRPTKLFLLYVVLVVGISIYTLFCLHRARLAKQELATILHQIATITLYDLDLDDGDDPRSLEAAISAPFPVEIFARAAGSARYHGGFPVWKGSSLAIMTLRDGTQRRARFSYYGGFFALDGVSGRFSVPGEGFSDFNEFRHQFVLQHFVPRRAERNKARSPESE